MPVSAGYSDVWNQCEGGPAVQGPSAVGGGGSASATLTWDGAKQRPHPPTTQDDKRWKEPEIPPESWADCQNGVLPRAPEHPCLWGQAAALRALPVPDHPQLRSGAVSSGIPVSIPGIRVGTPATHGARRLRLDGSGQAFSGADMLHLSTVPELRGRMSEIPR